MPAHTSDASLRRIAWPRHELIATGSRYSLDRDLRAGVLVRLLPGVYLRAADADSFVGRVAAASLWMGTRGMVGGSAAASIHALTETPPRVVSIVTVPSVRLRVPPWIRVRRLRLPMSAMDVGGIAVVSVADAILQAWGELPRDRSTAMLIDAVRDHRVNAKALARRASEYPRLRHRRSLVRLLGLLRDGPESYLEYLAMTRVFQTRAFVAFRRQVSIRAMGRRYVLDMFDDVAKVAVELDGRRFHGDDASRRRDLERDADLAAIGIVTIRLTYEDITERPRWCRSRVRRALRAHQVA